MQVIIIYFIKQCVRYQHGGDLLVFLKKSFRVSCNRRGNGGRRASWLLDKAQNPLVHQFPRNLPVDGKLPTCYGLTTRKLV